MKQLRQFITEKFKISSKNVNKYKYHPKTKEELEELIKKLINEHGNEANLNDIDVSNIEDMYFIFYDIDFNGDISKWDVSNVKNMKGMFKYSTFNNDISEWDVSNVENMDGMFNCSKFNGDISNWNVSNVKDMKDMFFNCPLEKNPPKWYHD